MWRPLRPAAQRGNRLGGRIFSAGPILAMAEGQIVAALHLDQARGGALELEGAVAGDVERRRGSASAAASSFTLCS